jgi:hypothetical protein
MTAMPVWPIALMLGVAVFGRRGISIIYGGWFEAKVYAPYHSVADVQRFQPNTDPDASYLALGRKALRRQLRGLPHGNRRRQSGQWLPAFDGF